MRNNQLEGRTKGWRHVKSIKIGFCTEKGERRKRRRKDMEESGGEEMSSEW